MEAAVRAGAGPAGVRAAVVRASSSIFGGIYKGSFSSLEAANKLVNSTISDNQDQIALVVNGKSPRENIDKDFNKPTGREAFIRNHHSQAQIRETYSVRVVVIPDRSTPKGYRADTAFPRTRRC